MWTPRKRTKKWKLLRVEVWNPMKHLNFTQRSKCMTQPKQQIDRKDVTLAKLEGFHEGVMTVTNFIAGSGRTSPKTTPAKKRGPKGPWAHKHPRQQPVEMNKGGATKNRRPEQRPSEPEKAA